MNNYVECPFCGEQFHGYANRAEAEHPPITECPLFGRILSIEQWNMRPPKKEVGHTPKVTQDEVEWLRSMVERLTVAPAPLHIEYKLNEDAK